MLSLLLLPLLTFIGGTKFSHPDTDSRICNGIQNNQDVQI